jgi:hypothetical protein
MTTADVATDVFACAACRLSSTGGKLGDQEDGRAPVSTLVA